MSSPPCSCKGRSTPTARDMSIYHTRICTSCCGHFSTNEYELYMEVTYLREVIKRLEFDLKNCNSHDSQDFSSKLALFSNSNK